MKKTSRVIGLAALSMLFSLGSVPTASATSMVTIVVTGVDFRFDGSRLTDISPSPGAGSGVPAQANAAASVTYLGVNAPTQTANVYMDLDMPIPGGIALPSAPGTTSVNVDSSGIFNLLLPNEDGTACSSACWGLVLDVTSYTVSYTDLGTVEITFTSGMSGIFFQDLPGFSIHPPVTFTLSGAVASSTNDGSFLTGFVVTDGVATFRAQVPEPGMTLLLGLGLVGAGIIGRKRGR
jgi:PEP-CTERM motif-containing protein